MCVCLFVCAGGFLLSPWAEGCPLLGALCSRIAPFIVCDPLLYAGLMFRCFYRNAAVALDDVMSASDAHSASVHALFLCYNRKGETEQESLQ